MQLEGPLFRYSVLVVPETQCTGLEDPAPLASFRPSNPILVILAGLKHRLLSIFALPAAINPPRVKLRSFVQGQRLITAERFPPYHSTSVLPSLRRGFSAALFLQVLVLPRSFPDFGRRHGFPLDAHHRGVGLLLLLTAVTTAEDIPRGVVVPFVAPICLVPEAWLALITLISLVGLLIHQVPTILLVDGRIYHHGAHASVEGPSYPVASPRLGTKNHLHLASAPPLARVVPVHKA